MAQIGGRLGGKTAAMEKLRDEFLRKHPKATVATCHPGGEVIVEKHVEELGPLRLTDQRKE
jgi:hypothetical protein